MASSAAGSLPRLPDAVRLWKYYGASMWLLIYSRNDSVKIPVIPSGPMDWRSRRSDAQSHSVTITECFAAPHEETELAATSGLLVLLAEDDPKTSKLLSLYLVRDGFDVITAGDGRRAVDLFASDRPGFVVLDVMLPLMDGWEVCQKIRRTSETPILFLTARDDVSDRLLGLGLGADDYVLKPFSPREVVARIRGILRRTTYPARVASRILTFGPLTMDLDRRRVDLSGRAVSLTPLEHTLLAAMMAAPGRVFLREELIAHLYPHGEVVVDRVIDVHIGKLRQKIEPNPAEPTMIFTVRGLGYRFADLQSEASL